jgi:predicted transcriptional regulator
MNTRYIKVEGHENLYRDSLTGAIVNTDKPAPKSFSSQFSNAIDDINTLKEEISEIKQLLREIVRNGSS